MLTSDFDYELPDERIAQSPGPRGESRLFHLPASGDFGHHRFEELPELLRRGDLLVLNDTRVVPARLFGRSEPGGGRTEFLLVEKLDETEWTALVKPGRRARPGSLFRFRDGLTLESLGRVAEDGRFRVRFSAPVEPHLPELGHMPLPPYIRRLDDEEDRERYQTIYARAEGAIAAPTAGLHFTDELFPRLANAGIEHTFVTLHVGIGTFKPVTADLVHEHRMESERFSVPEEAAAAIERTRSSGGRIVAVGTTVTRTLETVAADHGGEIPATSGATRLFITPGHRFLGIDALVTNFHLPRSTLLMLVSALAGRERLLAAYREAVEAGYRFYSYGDAMLIEKAAGDHSDGR